MKNNIRNELVSGKLKQYAKDEKKSLSVGLLLSMIRTGMEIIGPLIIGYILNNHISIDMERSNFITIALLLLIYLLVYLLSGLFSNLALVSFERAANKIAFSVQKDVYEHVSDLPISYFDNLSAGNIVSRITNDTNKLKMMFQLILADMTTSTIMIVALFGMILIRDFGAAILLLLLLYLVHFL